MTFIIIISCLLVASTFLYCYFYNKIPKYKIFALKLVTSFLFLLLAALTFIYKGDSSSNFDTLILLGICSGFIGDVVLGFRNMFPNRKHILFVVGIGFFLIGHIIYIGAMFSHHETEVLMLIILTILFFTFGILFTKITKVDFGKAFIVDYIYILISSIFLAATLLNAIELNDALYYILFVGVTSFVTSDIILSYLYFADVKPTSRYTLKLINIGTYYFGQMILALSILMF